MILCSQFISATNSLRSSSSDSNIQSRTARLTLYQGVIEFHLGLKHAVLLLYKFYLTITFISQPISSSLPWTPVSTHCVVVSALSMDIGSGIPYSQIFPFSAFLL